MIVTKRAISDASEALQDGAFTPDTTITMPLVYKISKNLSEIRRLQILIVEEIEALRLRYNWDNNKNDGGLEGETLQQYNREHLSILDQTMDAAFIPIKLSEIDFNVTLAEMQVLSVMIDGNE